MRGGDGGWWITNFAWDCEEKLGATRSCGDKILMTIGIGDDKEITYTCGVEVDENKKMRECLFELKYRSKGECVINSVLLR